LPGVHARHHSAIFGDLHESIDRRLGELAGKRDPSARALAGFLTYLRETVSPRRFSELQRKWVRPGLLGSDEPMLKFFDLVFWCEGKLRIANRLKLDQGTPVTIVDIGAGTGHFCFIAKHFNHRVIGTDLAPRSGAPSVLQMYADFRELFGIDWIAHDTTADAPLPPLNRDIHLCTALLTAFHIHADGVPWPVPEWRTFFRNLVPQLSNQRRSLYFQMNQAHLTDETWDYLSGLADWSFPRARHVEISSKLGLLTP